MMAKCVLKSRAMLLALSPRATFAGKRNVFAGRIHSLVLAGNDTLG